MSLEVTYKPAVVLVLGEGAGTEILVNCSGFVGKFAINTMPSMTVNVAADAINMRTGQFLSSREFTNFDESTPATLWIRFVDLRSLRAVWGKLFVGEFAGFDIRRGSTTAAFSISLRHSLAYLNYVSAISGTNHPGNPTDYAYPAVAAHQGSGATTLTRTWVPQIDENLVTDDGLTDLWTNILKKWLLALTVDDPFDLQLRNTAGLQLNTSLTEKIKQALEVVTIAPGVPIALDTSVAADSVSANIRDSLLDKSAGSNGDFVTATMWAKIIGEWAPEYLLELIPRAAGAWIIPSTGSLSASEFLPMPLGFSTLTDISMHTPLDQELQAVLLLMPAANLTGFDGTNVPDQSTKSGAYGLFKPTKDKSGVVVIRRPPSWLTKCDLSSAKDTEQADANNTVTAVDEVKEDHNPQAQDKAKTVRKAMSSIADKFAEQVYVNERLKGRTAKLTGCLRFDVCPGSHVQFKSSRESSRYVGKVIEVTIMMDAESKAVGTVMLLAHVRTREEDIKPGFSMKSSILYPKVFKYGSLVDIATPPPEVKNAV